jgi:hypothetical protein
LLLLLLLSRRRRRRLLVLALIHVLRRLRWLRRELWLRCWEHEFVLVKVLVLTLVVVMRILGGNC